MRELKNKRRIRCPVSDVWCPVFGSRPTALEPLSLSHREAEVLSWVACGKTNGEIGMILDLSPRTVQKHLEHTYQKLGVENRTAAAAKAYEITSARLV
jgi:DNA-binding CsgD family transcriptional regulator